MTWFVRIWRPSGLRCLTFRREFGMFGRWRDRDSRTVPDPSDDPCSPSTDDEPHCDPCPPCPSPGPPCPPFEPPIYHPYADPRKLVFWRMLSLCVALPVVVIMSAITYMRHQNRARQPREPFLDIPYMYRRTKPFPWGDGNHTLFHNPVKNPVPPHGYEVEDPNEMPKKAGN